MNGYRRLTVLGTIATISWMAFVYYLYSLTINTEREGIGKQALVEARIAYEKDITYRRWAAQLGGVYAEISDSLAPNPYLDVPDRDLTTQSGKKLTLINPAYMTRMVHGLMLEGTGLKAHITSLNPVRPENAPALWESQALESFQLGATEASEMAVEGGVEVLRFMRPMVTEKSCLKCHAKQGYKEGEIRGGISVTVPLSHYQQALAASDASTRERFIVIMFAGFGFIAFSSGMLVINERLRNRASRVLSASLREKDILLREIHHRVKNNLQIISSLLSLQEQGVDNPNALKVLADSQGRVMSMALIHEQLYRANDFSGIDARKYLQDFLPRLVSAYKGRRDISLRLAAPSINLVLDQAIPFGLIVNELVTNSLKHAFKRRDKGVISVAASVEEGVANLAFSDDGVGLPDSFNLETPTTLGLQIVSMLARQLHGEFTVEPGAGACFRIRFPLATAANSRRELQTPV